METSHTQHMGPQLMHDPNFTISADSLYETALMAKEYKMYDKMVRFLKKAVEKGHRQSMLELGKYYEEKKEADEMERCYRIAINTGSTDAMFRVGLHYELIKDYTKMFTYYDMAASAGDVQAMINLGHHYNNVQIDSKKSEKYYTMAIEEGSLLAMYNMGVIYSLKNDHDAAMKYFCMVFEHGGKDCQYIDKINANISKNIDKISHFVLRIYNYVNNENKEKLNKTLATYLSIKACGGELKSSPFECYVCMESREHLQLVCSHTICYKCFNNVKSCPLCRKDIK